MWFQYVVGYDKQEQRSLATSVNNRLFRYRHTFTGELAALGSLSRRHWPKALFLVMIAAFVVLLSLVLWRIRHFGWRRALGGTRAAEAPGVSKVEFYERLIRLLAARGFKRDPGQTPLEFAAGLGWQEMLPLTEAYNRVRYGAANLSAPELQRIEILLSGLEATLAENVTEGSSALTGKPPSPMQNKETLKSASSQDHSLRN